MLSENMQKIGAYVRHEILRAESIRQLYTANELLGELMDTVEIFPKQCELDLITDLNNLADLKKYCLTHQN